VCLSPVSFGVIGILGQGDGAVSVGVRAKWSHEQKYVFFRFKECLLFRRWEMLRPPVIGLSALVDEALNVLELYSLEGREHPKWILMELDDRFKNSVVLARPAFVDDQQRVHILIKGFLNDNKKKKSSTPEMETLTAILRALKAKMARLLFTETINSLLELFAKEGSPRYNQLDDLIFTLVNEFATQGFSARYVTEWIEQHGFPRLSFEEYLIGLREFYQRHLDRQFDCRFRLQVPENWTPASFYAFGVQIHRSSDSEAGFRFGHRGWEAKVSVSCRDHYQAAEIARTMVTEVAGLFQIRNVDADKTVSTKAFVVDKSNGEEWYVDVPRYEPSLLEAKNLPKFLEAQANVGDNWESIAAIRDAAYWLHLASDALVPHMRLINLWTVLELLIDIKKDSFSSPVFKYVPAFLQLYYLPVFIDYLMSELARAAVKVDHAFVAEAAASVHSGTTIKPAFALYVFSNSSFLEAHLGNKDILLRMIRRFVYLMENEGALKRWLDTYGQEVLNDLRRANRYRNWLIHRKVITSHTLNRTVDRLSFYVRTVINNILAALALSPSLLVKDVLVSKLETCNAYLKMCEKNRAIDIVEKVAYPRDLFV
jgi:hypothetical protein